MLDREIPGLEWFAQQPESTLIRGCRRRRVRRCSSPAAPRPWLVAEAARARASLREGETPWTKPQLTTRGGTPLEEAMWRVHPSLTQDDMTEPTHDEGPL